MKERIEELWRQSIQRLRPDTDYFIIINKNGEVVGREYQILDSIFIFSQYNFALIESEEFGRDTNIEKITREELLERFWEKFDFFELDPSITECENKECSTKTNSIPQNVLIELLDKKISRKIAEMNSALELLDKKFSDLEENLQNNVNISLEKIHILVNKEVKTNETYLRRKVRDTLRQMNKTNTEILNGIVTKTVKDYFKDSTKRSGNFKL